MRTVSGGGKGRKRPPSPLRRPRPKAFHLCTTERPLSLPRGLLCGVEAAHTLGAGRGCEGARPRPRPPASRVGEGAPVSRWLLTS